VVPISGLSESFEAHFGNGLVLIPAAAVEQLIPIASIPAGLYETGPMLIVWSSIALAAVLLAARAVRRSSEEARAIGIMLTVYATALALYYGCFFTASFFMNRYLAALSPFGALLVAGIVANACDALRARWGTPGANALLAALGTLILAVNVVHYQGGTRHPHKANFDLTSYRIPETAWIGAFQSGVLGYFHDRTINLDGKVNPEALAARQQGTILEYILNKRIDGAPIEYLVDYEWMANTAREPLLAGVFRVIVEDPARRIAVAVRTSSR